MTAARRDSKSPTAPAAPPYYIATAALYLDGSQFSRAHNAGDRVPAEHVERYGWADLVRPPDGYTATPNHTPSEPETTTGQATSSKEGDL